jgi:hypothetical protein
VTAAAPASGTPTGTVTFKDGGATLGTGTLSGGAATFAISSLAIGNHTITAVYAGDANFATSTGSLNTNPQVVNQASSTTAVTSSSNPSVFGQSVTFTATVAAAAPASGTPTGTVTFKDGSTTLGTGTLSGGAATFAISSLAIGNHTITAVYAGDTNFASSTGSLNTNPQVVNKGNSATAVTSSANPSVFGQSVTFTATVSATAPASGTPTGTVTFNDGSTTLGTGTLSSGAATFAISSLAIGNHTITAVYAGDTNFASSTGSLNTNPQVVNQAGSTTAVSSSANPSVFGQSVTFTATVAAVAPGSGTPTGTVTFKDGSTTLGTGTLSAGVATFAISSLAIGNHTITTVYAGDTNFATSTGSLNTNPQVVNQGSSTTAVTSSANPSVFGQSVTFTATVTAVAPGSGTPTGSVTFKDGSTTLGTGTLSGGAATFAISSLAIGNHTITAVYAGDTNFATSTGSLDTNPQVVNQAGTTTAVTSSANPSVFGQSVTFTATVAAVAPASGTPTGIVTFNDGANTIGTGTLSGGMATLTTSALTIGNHTITAVYAGDTNFATSTGSLNTNPQIVNQAGTTTAVTSSVNPSVFGQSVTFTATVAAVAPASGTPTGTVTFKDGSTTLGTGALSGGAATFGVSSLAIGNHTITAVYGGDTNFATSTGSLNTNPQVVNQAGSTTTLTSSANPSVFGQSVTFTATVAATAPGSGTPTGTVTFNDGASTIGTGTLSGGVATLTTSSLALGSHTITAVYTGDTDFAGSTGSLTSNSQVVNQASTSAAVSSSANPSVHGQAVTFTATVAALAPSSGVPSGTVTFKDGASVLPGSPVTLDITGTASLTAALSAGAHSITVVYNGDANYGVSTGSLPTQTVNPADTTSSVTSSANPSSFGQSVTFTATVTAVAPGAGTPTGTVTFLDGAGAIGTGTLSGGVATLTTSALAIGNHTITASYATDGNFNGSTGALNTNPQVVKQSGSTTAVTSSVNPSVFGQTVTFTATVTPSNATGTVTFKDGAAQLGMVSLLNGTASLDVSALAVGGHPITAVYSGDSIYNGSSGSLDTTPQVVKQANTTSSVSSSANPSNFNQAVTFTATVAAVAPGAGVPTGSVQFMDGATLLGAGTLDGSGHATYTTSALSVSSHPIKVVYGGDTSFTRSTSPVVNQTVAGADVSVSLSHPVDPAHLGAKLTFTATVINNGPSSTDVTFQQTFTGTYSLVSASSTQGSCSGTGPVNCDLGTLTNGQSVAVTVVVIPYNVTRTIVATATATSSTDDSNLANNAATDTANVRFMPFRH